MARAHHEEFGFLHKRSPTLLGDVRHILTEQVGFGDFRKGLAMPPALPGEEFQLEDEQ